MNDKRLNAMNKALDSWYNVGENYIEVHLPKYRLVLTIREFEKAVLNCPDIWKSAVKRGKSWKRAEQIEKRQK
jgi:hypothetical protein